MIFAGNSDRNFVDSVERHLQNSQNRNALQLHLKRIGGDLDQLMGDLRKFYKYAQETEGYNKFEQTLNKTVRAGVELFKNMNKPR